MQKHPKQDQWEKANEERVAWVRAGGFLSADRHPKNQAANAALAEAANATGNGGCGKATKAAVARSFLYDNGEDEIEAAERALQELRDGTLCFL